MPFIKRLVYITGHILFVITLIFFSTLQAKNLEKYNNGRPIILASHSQGTSHTTRLLVDFFDGKKLQEKLLAAYIPGIPILPNQFKTIKPMTSPEEIGGFVSWNTFKKGHYPKNVKNWYNGAVTTNPITWDHNKFTTLSQHRGFLFTNQKIYENIICLSIKDQCLTKV